MDLDIADLAAVAAENLSHQFQSVDCTQPWIDYLSQTLGPNIWGPGDMYTLDSAKDIPLQLPQQTILQPNIPTIATQLLLQNQTTPQNQINNQNNSNNNTNDINSQKQFVKEIGNSLKDSDDLDKNTKILFSPKVFTGGTSLIQSFLQFLSDNDFNSIRYVMFAHGRNGGEEGGKHSSVLKWVVMCGKCKAKVDALIKKYNSLQKIPLPEIENEGITVYRVEQWEGDLLVLPPNSVCHAATFNGHVAFVSWLRQVPKTLSVLYDKYVVPNYHDPSSTNSVAIPVKFSIAKALSEVNNIIITFFINILFYVHTYII